MIVFVLSLCVVDFVVFKQKAAYEMRISDWSSDVCPSDLSLHPHHLEECLPDRLRGGARTQDLAGTLDEVRVDHQGGLLRCHAIYLLCHVAVDPNGKIVYRSENILDRGALLSYGASQFGAEPPLHCRAPGCLRSLSFVGSSVAVRLPPCFVVPSRRCSAPVHGSARRSAS